MKPQYKYLITAFFATVVFILCVKLQNTYFNDIFWTNRIFRTLPYFAGCIALPFYLFALLKICLKHFRRETSWLYLFVMACFLLMLYFEKNTSPMGFNVFNIIAGVTGLYLTMFLHYIYNKQG